MTATRLLIARHGNTFGPNETPTRVGARTDLPLVASGQKQAKNLGEYCQANHLTPDIIYCSELKRTQETAQIAFPTIKPQSLSIFNEIDYGPDENKTESEVIARLGQKALSQWNTSGIAPQGWVVDTKKIIQAWVQFADTILQQYFGKTVLVVTSNGIARFAPHITNEFDQFIKQHAIKLSTGALCGFAYQQEQWHTLFWNQRAPSS